MEIFLKIVHVIASVFLILVVLLQSGRGGGVGAAFGGASGQIFGGHGAGNFLTKLTSGSAIVFFVTALTLSMMSSRHRSVVLDAAPASTPAEAASGPADTGTAGKPPEPLPAADKAAPGDAKPGPASELLQQAPAGDAKNPPADKPNTPAPTPPGVPSGAPSR